MASKFRTRRQKIQHPFVAMGITALLIVLILLIIAVVLSNGTGFNGYTVKSAATETTLSPQAKVTITTQSQPGKTLWDLLQLLIIPLMLAIGGYWLNRIQKDREQRATDERAEREKREVAERAEREKRETEQRAKTERAIAADNQREASLQAYLDNMSELLLEKKLRDSAEEEEIRKIARVRTLTVLHRLDGVRKGSVIRFLHESGLIDKDSCIISLSGADLSEADLSKADLSRVYLSEADLSGADLNRADLSKADLSKANLSGANLKGLISLKSLNPSFGQFLAGIGTQDEANLDNAILDNAILQRAQVTQEQLNKAKSLKGAIKPDVSKHP